MKEEIVKELLYKLRKKRRTIKEMAEYCDVSRPTMLKLVNKGEGTIDLLEKARKFLALQEE